jgi:hypothetical protein
MLGDIRMIWWLRVDKVESGVKRIKEVSGLILITLNKTNNINY